MKYISTRQAAPALNFEDVILQGLAVDGGLYVPEFLPQFDEKKIAQFRKLSYQELFFEVTKHFVVGAIDDDTYRKIIDKSYKNFSHQAIAPLKQLSHNHFLLELFHGPTLAFKDFALQFLGNLLDHILAKRNEKIVIIGATSGDTGSAAIYGCMNCENADIFILHPHNRVSEVQRRQMTSVIADNVTNLAVEGNFDDCQALVKQMFADQSFLNGKRMVAVNSINWARIMAQIVYYFYAALQLGSSIDRAISFVVPTGNFGNVYAGFLVKRMGLNIAKLVVATNANDILTRFVNNNDYSRQSLHDTISPSMNIQVSSNFERLLFDMYKNNKSESKLGNLMREFEKVGKLDTSAEVWKNISQIFCSYSVDDLATKNKILQVYKNCQEVLDPHTAVAVAASDLFMASENYGGEMVVSLATAHIAKFPESLENLPVSKPQLPPFLSDLFLRKEKYQVVKNDLEQMKKVIQNFCHP